MHVACWRLHVACWRLHVASLRIGGCPLHVGGCTLHVVCPLHVVRCMPHAACRILGCCPRHAASCSHTPPDRALSVDENALRNGTESAPLLSPCTSTHAAHVPYSRGQSRTRKRNRVIHAPDPPCCAAHRLALAGFRARHCPLILVATVPASARTLCSRRECDPNQPCKQTNKQTNKVTDQRTRVRGACCGEGGGGTRRRCAFPC